VPLCCLSAILFVVAWNMSELPHLVRLVRGSPAPDVGVLLLTFALTVFVDLVVAVNVGVILGALFFMRRMALAVNIELQVQQSPEPDVPTLNARPVTSDVVIYGIDGPLFFGAAEKLERTLAHIQRPASTLILRMSGVPFVDATGILAIQEIITDLTKHGASVLLVEVRPNVLRKLERSGVIASLGAENVLDTLDNALTRARTINLARMHASSDDLVS
jgi:SulP family sulfate permease